MNKIIKNWGKIINYTSDVVMLLFVLVFYASVIYSMIIVWNTPNNLDDFVELVKDPLMLAVGGYWGRIAITHYQTIKHGGKVSKDIATEDDLEEKGVIK